MSQSDGLEKKINCNWKSEEMILVMTTRVHPVIDMRA
jgi:hypothetical protein